MLDVFKDELWKVRRELESVALRTVTMIDVSDGSFLPSMNHHVS